MFDNVMQWTEDSPAPASLMLISDVVDSDSGITILISSFLQQSNYNCKMTDMLTSAE